MAILARRVNAERVLLLGWSRAVLLQLAHPLVAAGVAEHSTFRGGRLTAAKRLHQTVHAMLALTFGDDAQYTLAISKIRAIHRRVHGRLPAAVGPFPAGTSYSAEDPALLLWVHATLVESIALAYDALVSPLSRRDRDTYCREAAPTAVALGADENEVPRTWVELVEYVDRVHASGVLVVSDAAHELADAVLSPPMAWLSGPVAWVNRLLTRAWLPSAIREQYGWGWDARDERRLRSVMRVLRAAHRATPPVLRVWSEARHSFSDLAHDISRPRA